MTLSCIARFAVSSLFLLLKMYHIVPTFFFLLSLILISQGCGSFSTHVWIIKLWFSVGSRDICERSHSFEWCPIGILFICWNQASQQQPPTKATPFILMPPKVSFLLRVTPVSLKSSHVMPLKQREKMRGSFVFLSSSNRYLLYLVYVHGKGLIIICRLMNSRPPKQVGISWFTELKAHKSVNIC